MDAQQFAYWLQGFAELSQTPPTQEQWDSIREHLALVFKKVTPPVAHPKPDLSYNNEIKKLLDRAQRERMPNLPQNVPWQPYYLRGDGEEVKLGHVIC